MKKDVTIAIPTYDSRVEYKLMQEAIIACHLPDSPVKNILFFEGDSLVSRARNRLVRSFMMGKTDYLLFIDSDILFEVSQIVQLRKHDKPFMTGVYLKKKLPYAPVCNKVLEECGNGLIKVREAGTGFMMVSREVFTTISDNEPNHYYRHASDEPEGDKYYDYFRNGVFDGEYLSEDYYFCRVARNYGYEIFMDTTCVVRHVGRAIFPMNDTDILNTASMILTSFVPGKSVEDGVLEKLESSIKTYKETR